MGNPPLSPRCIVIVHLMLGADHHHPVVAVAFRNYTQPG